eukprot:gb/GEZN01010636.1/.p1 GENE.gb/GEZN01010636.1/~~gb/GEZN01010636.1/.p1  ORF type:complete len:250 (-),score=22.53 gb/GEZN01010636.1/:259-1008(-)
MVSWIFLVILFVELQFCQSEVATVWKGNAECVAGSTYSRCECVCQFQNTVAYYPGQDCNEKTCSSDVCGQLGNGASCTTPLSATCAYGASVASEYSVQSGGQCQQLDAEQLTIYYDLTCGPSNSTNVTANISSTFWSAYMTSKKECKGPYLRARGDSETCISYTPIGYAFPFSFKVDCSAELPTSSVAKTAALAAAGLASVACVSWIIFNKCKSKRKQQEKQCLNAESGPGYGGQYDNLSDGGSHPSFG